MKAVIVDSLNDTFSRVVIVSRNHFVFQFYGFDAADFDGFGVDIARGVEKNLEWKSVMAEVV